MQAYGVLSILWTTWQWWVLPLKIRVPPVASSMQWCTIIKLIPIMAGASISATTISCNTGEGSVPTLKLSCTTLWVSTVLPSSTRSCPMSPTSVTSYPRWILSNTLSHHVPVGSCPTHHVPVGSCPTPCHIMSPLDPVQHIMSPLDPVQHRVTSCPRWILSNTSCPRLILSNTVSHQVPVGSCPTPMDESCWWLSLSRLVPLLVFHLPPYCGKLPWQSLFKIQVRPRIAVDEIAPRLSDTPLSNVPMFRSCDRA